MNDESRMSGKQDAGAGGGNLVDFTQFDAMIDGPESPCVEIYRDFVKAAELSVARIGKAAREGDSSQVESISHQHKGASASFGLVGFSALMSAAESAARSGTGISDIASEAWVDGALQMLGMTIGRVEADRGIGV